MDWKDTLPSIVMNIPFGNEYKKAEISHDRWGTGGFIISLNEGYNGYISIIRDCWQLGHFPSRSELTTADWQIISELLNEKHAFNYPFG